MNQTALDHVTNLPGGLSGVHTLERPDSQAVEVVVPPAVTDGEAVMPARRQPTVMTTSLTLDDIDLATRKDAEW